jgi:hypothetical protein
MRTVGPKLLLLVVLSNVALADDSVTFEATPDAFRFRITSDGHFNFIAAHREAEHRLLEAVREVWHA